MLESAYGNAVLNLLNVCDLFACSVGPATNCYTLLLTLGAVSEIQLGERGKNPLFLSEWPCP